MNTEITFYQSLICPRFIRVRRILGKIKEDYPDLIITKFESITKFLKRELHTLPAIKINKTILYGKEITENRILIELGLQ
ncbi:MAG: hypothetical protein ACXADY_08350 [Candidatus Hodarchaeales archaeon]